MSTLIPSSEQRVPVRSPEAANRFISRRTYRALRGFENATPEEITLRIEELKQEWDIERVLELNAGLLVAITSFCALNKHRGWAVVSALVGSFLVQHAVHGWCPPLPFLRRAGVRTPREIHDEIMALRLLRGDFADGARGNGLPVPAASTASTALAQVQSRPGA